MPHRFASPGFAFAGTVVRDEEAQTSVRNQMQVAVEVLCVAGMSNDSVAISGFLIEAERHAIQLRHIGKLAGVHQSRSIRAEYLCAFKASGNGWRTVECAIPNGLNMWLSM